MPAAWRRVSMAGRRGHSSWGLHSMAAAALTTSSFNGLLNLRRLERQGSDAKF